MNLSILLFFNLGPWEIIAIVFVIILLFGAKRIPELAKGLGKGIKEFKDASKDEDKKEKEEDKK